MLAILASCGTALIEYVFASFSVWVLKTPLGWNHAIGFGLIALGAWFVFQGK